MRTTRELDADLCIVGGGPAGLGLARGLLDSGLSVAVLESGPLARDLDRQRLNDGDVRGSPYPGLVATRHRQVGGSTRLWNTAVRHGLGAKYLPLEAIDLGGRPHRELGAWPFGLAVLAPYYERAQNWLGLGPCRYDAATWAGGGLSPLELTGGPFATGVYQLGATDPFETTYLALMSPSSSLRLWPDLTVPRLSVDSRGRIGAVEAVDWSGERVRVRARAVVLAAGAVENARLLLASGATPADAPGNGSGWVGRGFMEHPRDRSLRLVPRDRAAWERLAFHRRHLAADGVEVLGRWHPAPDWLAAENLPNASLLLAAARPRGRLRRWLPARGVDPVDVVLHLEQRPDPANRVGLGAGADRFGIPRPRLEWRWSPEEARSLERIRSRAAEAFRATGLMTVEHRQTPLDPAAHHHAGTTRFHADPTVAVADPDGRVHGTENLYVLGASLFPSAGVANPTLTIAALALRMADHLRERLGGTVTPAPAPGPVRS